MPEPAPATSLPEAPTPPSFREFLEATLQVPLIPKKIFDSYSLLPEPSVKLIMGNILLWTTGACFLYGLLQYVQNAILPQTAALYFIALPAILILVAGTSLVLAWAIHGLAILSGGAGGYKRSLQAVSMLSLIIPLCTTASISPKLLIIPGLYWIYLAIRGISSLHHVPFPQASLVTGASIIALILGLRISWNLLARRNFFESISGQISYHPESPLEGPVSAAAASPNNISDNRMAGSTPSRSGLDLVQSASLPALSLQSENSVQPPSPAQIQQMQAMSAGLLGNLIGLSQNAAFMNSLTPQQKTQMHRLMLMSRNLLNLYQTRSKGGTQSAALSDAEAKHMTQQLQQIMQSLQTMQASGQTQAKSDVP